MRGRLPFPSSRSFQRLVPFLSALAAVMIGGLAGAAVPALDGRQAATTPDDSVAFAAARRHALEAQESLRRSHRYLEAWLAHADPRTGLIPRNLTDSRDFWNGRDAAADNYAFMVLTAAMTDRPRLNGPLLAMLRSERRLTARVGHLADDYSFSRRDWRRHPFDLQATLFDSAEYAKDGLVPVTEWIGPGPWSARLEELVSDLWAHASIDSPFGLLPTLDFEVNGDLLQAGARLFALTGDRRYLDWTTRIGDYYLLGSHHPTRHGSRLRLRDHGCEVVNGLTELYVALRAARPEHARQYTAPLHEIFDRILAVGRNGDGLLYDWFDPRTGEHSPGLCDTWGYTYDGFYTLYLLDHVPAYRDAVRVVLGSLDDRYRNYRWEGDSADGYADAIEGALNLLQREPVETAAAWIDSEIRVLWSKQRPDGIIEGWHGDGNFARTCLMHALWKTQGVLPVPWRPDLRLGAARNAAGDLYLAFSASRPWRGRLVFDRPRHREVLHLPLDYPRINQFPEWFAPADGAGLEVEVEHVDSPSRTLQPARQWTARQLHRGLPLRLDPRSELLLKVRPAPH